MNGLIIAAAVYVAADVVTLGRVTSAWTGSVTEAVRSARAQNRAEKDRVLRISNPDLWAKRKIQRERRTAVRRAAMHGAKVGVGRGLERRKRWIAKGKVGVRITTAAAQAWADRSNPANWMDLWTVMEEGLPVLIPRKPPDPDLACSTCEDRGSISDPIRPDLGDVLCPDCTTGNTTPFPVPTPKGPAPVSTEIGAAQYLQILSTTTGAIEELMSSAAQIAKMLMTLADEASEYDPGQVADAASALDAAVRQMTDAGDLVESARAAAEQEHRGVIDAADGARSKAVLDYVGDR